MNARSSSQTPRPSNDLVSSDAVAGFASPSRVGWRDVVRRVDRLWVPDQAPHHSIVGQTRSGKTYLVTRGLFPLVRDDKVLIIDNKGGDPTLAGYGKPVREIPKYRRLSDERRPRENWFHLLVHDDRDRARDQVAKALDEAYREGGWTIYADETRALTDPRSPGLGLQPLLDRIWLRGGSHGVTLIAATQAPRWVPSSFYDQCAFVWVSRIRDRRAHERVMEIGSMTREHIPTISALRKRQWLYMDDEEDETFAALTAVGQ